MSLRRTYDNLLNQGLLSISKKLEELLDRLDQLEEVGDPETFNLLRRLQAQITSLREGDPPVDEPHVRTESKPTASNQVRDLTITGTFSIASDKFFVDNVTLKEYIQQTVQRLLIDTNQRTISGNSRNERL
jgi:hypothetical protein